ncbi:VanZ like family protein [Lachnospiraceae bacterium]|nr:VanZ like family protein [Lachnospiraceae bacterium]
MNNNKSTAKCNIRKIVFLILSIVWMVVIFLYSSRDAALSTTDSQTVALTIGDLTIEDFNQWSTEQQYQYAASIDHPVRKAAHFTEYFILGMLLLGAWYDAEHRKLFKKNVNENDNKPNSVLICIFNALIPLMISLIYAVSDEYHQTHVSGRSGMMTDVLIDGSGALAGIIIALLLITLIGLIRRRHK